MIIAVMVPSYRSFNILTNDNGFIVNYKKWLKSNSSNNKYKLYLLAQGYSQDQQDVIKSMIGTIDCKIEFVGKYKDPISMTLIRDDCCSLSDKETDFCFMIDDDFKLFPDSMNKINLGVNYMVNHPQCGYIQFDGFLGGYRQGDFLKIKREGLFYTSSGMLIRKLHLPDVPRFLPIDAIGLSGIGEETLIAATMYKNGFYVGKVKNVNVGSLESRNTRHLYKRTPDGFWSIDPNLVVTEDSRGIMAIPPNLNPYNPENNKQVINYINNMLGITKFYSKLRFEGKFWERYISVSTEKFGNCEGNELLDSLVPF